MSEIRIGDLNAPQFTFIVSGEKVTSGYKQVDLIANELAIDTFDPEVSYVFIVRAEFHGSEDERFITADGDIFCGYYNSNLAALPYGTPVWYVRQNETMRFYAERVERKSKDMYALSCVSIIGLFDNQYHVGGVYTGQRTVDVIAEIFGGSVGTLTDGYYPITGGVEDCKIAQNVGDEKMYGYLPYDTKRKNLHQILFASGASLVRENAEIHFRYLDDLEAQEIPRSRIYIGNSVKYDAMATGVEITEHTYQWAYNEEPTEQYNNTDAYSETADHARVIFSTPIKVDTAAADGLTIHELRQNYAVVSGKGTLSAIPYVHITRTLSKSIQDAAGPSNMKTFTGCTLISPMNSENVLERLYQFYTSAYVQNAAVEVDSETAGKEYSFTNEFDEQISGILTTMDYNETSLVKADSTFILGYTPGNFGNNYNNAELLTDASGTWNVPNEVRTSSKPYMRITLIGGGEGGDGGEGGKQGRGTYYTGTAWEGYGGGKGGSGGKGGEAGQGGKVLTISKLDVSGIHHIAYICGDGGAGGAGGTGGENDTDPTAPGIGLTGRLTAVNLYDDAGQRIDTYNSSSGYVLPRGIIDLVHNKVFALSGIDGTDGADGGDGGAAAFGANGTDGGNVEFDGVMCYGGNGSDCEYREIAGTQLQAFCGGGGGGGAAVGEDAPHTQETDVPNRVKRDFSEVGYASAYQCAWGGQGGKGADAVKIRTVSSVTYGQGGDGGHGGGGGGTGGAQNWRPLGSAIRDGFPGNGGNGSAGYAGQGGCIFIYY